MMTMSECAGSENCDKLATFYVNEQWYCGDHNPWHNGGPDDPCVYCRSKDTTVSTSLKVREIIDAAAERLAADGLAPKRFSTDQIMERMSELERVAEENPDPHPMAGATAYPPQRCYKRIPTDFRGDTIGDLCQCGHSNVVHDANTGCVLCTLEVEWHAVKESLK